MANVTPIFSQKLSDLRRAAVIAVAIMAVGSVAAPDFAAAQGLFGFEDPAPSARQRRRANAQRAREVRPARREAAAKPDSKPAKDIKVPKVAIVVGPPEPLVAVISVQSQRIQVHGTTGMMAESKVSTGTSGHRTPTGVFSVLQRNRYHESNIYSGAPMPFMQRVTWSGIAMHQGVVPGYPASHGCIRLPGDFATRLWGIGRVGMRVIIAPGDVHPQAIEHARLPVPVMTAVAVNDIPAPIQTAAVAGPSADSEQRLLDPFKYAQTRKVKIVADHVAAAKAVQPAFDLARDKSAEASRFADELRRLERSVAAAEQKVGERQAAAQAAPQAEAAPATSAAIVTASVPSSPQAGAEKAPGQAETVKPDAAALQPSTPATDKLAALSAAEQELVTARSELTAARATEQSKSDAAFDAAKAARDAEAAALAAADASKLANVATEPVTIFVSRKEGRVFVRQGFVPLHDEPITFTEPDRALGTHVFTAMTTKDGGAGLGWQVVTVPNTPPEIKSKEDKPRKKGKGAEAVEAKPQLPASTASAALDRFELPAATRKLVEDRVWPGASLIVSDYGISGETGKGTDFVVLTK